ncbi:MAG: winged helix-turn-helix transcriptional regulator, partial [Comamonas sp.]|nr:winged helix-turn-helix transcriptional regulator [Comamonas sp.]
MHALDRTDRRILDILQREGRIAITELAERVGLSASPCSERIKRMERAGVIT